MESPFRHKGMCTKTDEENTTDQCTKRPISLIPFYASKVSQTDYKQDTHYKLGKRWLEIKFRPI